MATKGNSGDNRSRSSMSIVIVAGLCCFFYILGAWQRSGFGKGDSIAVEITRQTDCSILSNLNYETHRGGIDDSEGVVKEFKSCGNRYIDYTPCQDQMRAMTFPRENMNYRERHCPPEEEKLHCLIPAPKGYVTPFRWPQSRDYVPYANAPYKSLTVEKAVQNWIQYEGNVFRFPGGGTQFPHGADAYINELAAVIPMDNGMVRTALDTGCGVASWGAYLFKKNVIAMSFAPRDSHEAQVQFALERGVPAVIGVLGTIKLPYPSRAFDMAHCSRCLIPWGANDGMYMMEVDRVLRPGGYWVLSGPPINWRNNYVAWQRPKEELEEEQRKIEEVAKLLNWEKKHEKGEIAIWRKLTTSEYRRDQDPQPNTYQKMELCVTPYPETSDANEDAGGPWIPFPERLNALPFRISSDSVPDVSAETFQEDNKAWKKHVNAYKRTNKLMDTRRYRNIMDMNAGLGSFAAALDSPKLWVMNVMPTIAEKDTCEAFSTYPRTYDLIHANGVFSLYRDKCNAEDILLEMDRILRPEGAVIFRDHMDVLVKVSKLVRGMRWNTKMVDHEDGPLVPEKNQASVEAMEGEANNGTRTQDASFSSYLRRAEGSVHIPNPPPATKTEGETGVFGAEKYFSMMLEDDGPRLVDYDTSKFGQKKKENRGGQQHKQPKSRPGTPSTCSEASWNSQSGLLSWMRTPSQSKKKKVNGKINVFSSFSCNGSCSDKKSISVHEMNAAHGGRGNKDFRKQNVGNIDHNPAKQPQPRSKARDEVNYSSFERSNKEEHFALANLNSGAQKLAGKSQLEEKKMKEQEGPRKLLEVFGSQRMKEDNVAINSERRLSMLTSDAIPKAPVMNEDAESDASSDLFEIESL
ncbi:hypothetical protein DVH24_008857 [Malus domestica]|uniref:Methyltransferase n=1 Tax=Malus domestica TaxID=3750 RepID=A0A498JR40_MALDO|nr:hypothetical protein DVH24_008857 [Malus domestica]